MNQAAYFKPNVDHLIPFNSQVMLINDIPGSENGMNLIRANTDGPPIHSHPIQKEVLGVVQGELEVFKDGKWNKLSSGQKIFIAEGEPHSYRNRSMHDCIFEYKLTPNGSFSDMMLTFEKLAKEKKLTSTKDFKSLCYLALAFKKYSKEVRSVNPPNFVMSLFAFLGNLQGLKI